MKSFDETKSGIYTTKLKEVMIHSVNWDKVKTFEDFILLMKHNIIKSNFLYDDDLKGKDKEISKFFKVTGVKGLIFDSKEDKKV